MTSNRRVAKLIAASRAVESPREAAIAAKQLADLVSGGKISNRDIKEIADASTVGVSAPRHATVEPWRSTIASAIAILHSCRAFWRHGAITFVGGEAPLALSLYMRAVTEADVYAVMSFKMSEKSLSLRVPSTSPELYGFLDKTLGDLGSLFNFVGPSPVATESVATREATVLWMDMFRNAFAKSLFESLVGKVEEERVTPQVIRQDKSFVPPEIDHAKALKAKLKDNSKVANVVQRAESLGTAAGARWRAEKRRLLLMECVSCSDLKKTLGLELAVARDAMHKLRQENEQLKAAAVESDEDEDDFESEYTASAPTSIDDLIAAAPKKKDPVSVPTPAATAPAPVASLRELLETD